MNAHLDLALLSLFQNMKKKKGDDNVFLKNSNEWLYISGLIFFSDSGMILPKMVKIGNNRRVPYAQQAVSISA